MNNVHEVDRYGMNNVQDPGRMRSAKSATQDRHRDLARKLIVAAEAVIVAQGLPALRARTLAEAAGCSVGAIYGVFPTLDALILAVNDRTLAALQRRMEAEPWPGGPDAQLLGFALSYHAFAAANPNLWAALFQHRLPAGQAITPDYAARQAALFGRVAEPIRALCPALPEADLSGAARTLFSAVHGVVQLGLEQKLGVLEPEALERQLRWLIQTVARGLAR